MVSKRSRNQRFEALLRAVVLAVRQAGELDGAPHIARVRYRSRELVERLVAALDQGRRNQRHAACDRIHRDQVQALALVGGELAEKGSQQIGKRR